MNSSVADAALTPDVGPIQAEIGMAISVTLARKARPNAKCWVFADVRQDAGRWQCRTSGGPNRVGISIEVDGARRACAAECESIRTLDLYPIVPEFLTVCSVDLPEAKAGSVLRFTVDRWQTPERPIARFRFWLLFDLEGEMEFEPTGYKKYRSFFVRGGAARVGYERLVTSLVTVSFRAEGEYRPVPPANLRRTPGIAWGELHGMAFNQRPLDDFYEYAKRVTELDFCAAVLFSYNTCVDNVWQEVKEARRRHLQRGRFIPILAFECGTPIDDSHRVAYFVGETDVPPIFCDSRPPALDPHLQNRFHPDTIRCPTIEDFYETVHRYGGFVAGHFHTLSYQQELLAELWQKQEFTARYQRSKPFMDEEQNVYEYLRRGMKLGFTGGSDTHDSMPGNPYPEPGCPRPSGFTGVLLDELTPEGLDAALRARRTVATSGARIGVWVTYDVATIGDIARYRKREPFVIRVDAPDEIDRVELLKNGEPVAVWNGAGSSFETTYVPLCDDGEDAFYHVRVRQRNGHLAWSSPVWLQFP